MLNKLESILMSLAEKIGRNRYLIAVRDGFLLSMPLLTIGSFSLLITNLPIPGWTDFQVRSFGDNQASYSSKPIDVTFSIMAVLAVIGISYSSTEQMNVGKLFGAAIALMSWLLIMPYETLVGGGSSVSGVSLNWVGSKGISVGITVTFLSVHTYAWVNRKGWVIRMPDGAPPTVVKSLSTLTPTGISILVFFIMDIVLTMIPCKNAFNFIFAILQTPLLRLGNTLPVVVIAYVFPHPFWLFEVNGSFMVGAVFNPILQALFADNLATFRAGQALPNIISQQFQDLFATFDGCGSTLSLLIAMLLFCHSKRIKKLGRLALIPGVFGINEPIVFSPPIVLNPMILIPFMPVPTINIVISYFCMNIDLIPICTGVAIPWIMPMMLSEFLATGWQGAMLQLLLLVLGVFVYMPLIRMMDKQYLEDEAKASERSGDDDFDFDDLSFDDLQDGYP